jgi:hypothetical protein
MPEYSQGVLMDAQRSLASVGRSDDAKPAPALRRAEAFLLVTGIDPRLPGPQSDLEDMRPVGPRRIGLAVAKAASGGHALELARPDDPRATRRILVPERAFPNVGEDLGIAMRVARNACARWETVFVEALEGSETVGRLVPQVLRVEREPDLLLAMSVQVALFGPTERNHCPAPRPALTMAAAPGWLGQPTKTSLDTLPLL